MRRVRERFVWVQRRTARKRTTGDCVETLTRPPRAVAKYTPDLRNIFRSVERQRVVDEIADSEL